MGICKYIPTDLYFSSAIFSSPQHFDQGMMEWYTIATVSGMELLKILTDTLMGCKNDISKCVSF